MPKTASTSLAVQVYDNFLDPVIDVSYTIEDNTVGELVQKDLNDLYNIKNFGKKSAEEINSKLKEYDLALSASE